MTQPNTSDTTYLPVGRRRCTACGRPVTITQFYNGQEHVRRAIDEDGHIIHNCPHCGEGSPFLGEKVGR